MIEVTHKKKFEEKVVRRDPDIYREDTMVRVVNQAKRDQEFDELFGHTIRKVKRFFNIVINILTVFFSLLGLGTAIWFIATVLV